MALLPSLLLWNLLFLGLGSIATILHRESVRPGWFGLALILFNINVLLVLGPVFYADSVSSLIGSGSFEFNWIGKVLAFAVTLAILIFGPISLKEAGLTLRQSPRARLGWIVLAGLIASGVALALFMPNQTHSAESILYQLTMPSLEEEIFHRGLLLAVLFRAFDPKTNTPPRRFAVAPIVSAAMFTLIHGLYMSTDGLGLSFEALTFAGIFAVLLTWLRLRTGSVIAPIILHSAVNTIWRVL